VHNGDIVTLHIPTPEPAEPKPEALHIKIIYDDPDIVIVDKPAGMVVHPAPGHTSGTLVNALLDQVKDLSGIGGKIRPGIVHRLDRETSGILVVAKHDQAHAELSRQFKNRDVEKTYITLVWGIVKSGKRIDLPIGRDPINRKKISIRSTRPREAVTRIEKAEHLKDVSLLHVAIETGRTHQIRVHLSSIGHPVVGDILYGGKRHHLQPHLQEVQKLERHFLHSTRIAFAHPRDGRVVCFTSHLPEELENTIRELRRQSDRKT
jgi:23S rRNA pseudouridine1911/1915/1917 synthase